MTARTNLPNDHAFHCPHVKVDYPFNRGDLLNGDRSIFSLPSHRSLSSKYWFLTIAFAERLYRQHNPFVWDVYKLYGNVGKKPIEFRIYRNNEKWCDRKLMRELIYSLGLATDATVDTVTRVTHSDVAYVFDKYHMDFQTIDDDQLDGLVDKPMEFHVIVNNYQCQDSIGFRIFSIIYSIKLFQYKMWFNHQQIKKYGFYSFFFFIGLCFRIFRSFFTLLLNLSCF